MNRTEVAITGPGDTGPDLTVEVVRPSETCEVAATAGSAPDPVEES